MSSKLTDLAARDVRVKNLLTDSTVGHRTAARDINRLLGDGTTTERSVRRYRARVGLVLEGLVSPYGAEGKTVAHRPRRELPVQQWVPGIDMDDNGGEFRTRPTPVTPDAPRVEPEEADLLRSFNLDPDVWEVTAARKSEWQSGENWLEAKRVSFRKRGSGHSVSPEDVEKILGKYSVYPRGTLSSNSKQKTLVVPAGDLQLGKQDGGGTKATVERFGKITERIAIAYDDNDIHNLVLPWLGDCIEGSVSQGGRNIVNLDATPAEQVRIYRRLMMHQIAVLAPLARRVLVPVVPGNHDETTRLQNMPARDSWAIEGAVAVQDWMQGRPEYAHVQFIYPDIHEADITVDIAGVTASFMHGHSSGKSRPEGILDWWKGQSHGRQLAGEADILLTAHWHHLRVQATGGNRTWIQIPALDGGSDWYRHKTGDEPDAGIISFELTPGVSPSWTNLQVWT